MVVHSLIGVLSVSLQAFSEVGQVLDQTFFIDLLVDILNYDAELENGYETSDLSQGSRQGIWVALVNQVVF